MINVYKSPISKEKYANLFLDKIPEGAKNVCLLFIGHSETVHYIMSQKPEIDFTVIDGSDVTEALPYIYTADNLKERITFEESDCEDETFLKKLETCFENYIMNNMSFDLIIANPPYGKSSSLSKKIVNKMLECKVAEEYVVLAPPKTFYESAKLVKDYIDVGLTSDLFDIPAANGIRVGIAKYTNQVVNRYTEKSLRFTDKKLLQLEEALTAYNSIHETIEDTKYKHCGLDPKGVAYFKAEIEKGLDPCRIFLIPYYTPLNGARWGECGDHNNDIKLWDFQNGKTSSATVIVLKEGYKKNFCKWWYKDYEDKEKNWKNLHYAICRVIRAAWSDGPGSVAFLQYLPRVDWSKSWTDVEILAELGLPEDFLEKEENENNKL